MTACAATRGRRLQDVLSQPCSIAKLVLLSRKRSDRISRPVIVFVLSQRGENILDCRGGKVATILEQFLFFGLARAAKCADLDPYAVLAKAHGRPSHAERAVPHQGLVH